MNWKNEAMDKLRQYEARKNALKSIPQEIEQLKASRSAIRGASSDAMPVRGGGNGREDMLLSSIVKEEELERVLRSAKLDVVLTDAGLECLDDEERLILDRFYIHPLKGNVDRLCAELGIEKSQVYKRKDDALRHFTIALYGYTET